MSERLASSATDINVWATAKVPAFRQGSLLLSLNTVQDAKPHIRWACLDVSKASRKSERKHNVTVSVYNTAPSCRGSRKRRWRHDVDGDGWQGTWIGADHHLWRSRPPPPSEWEEVVCRNGGGTGRSRWQLGPCGPSEVVAITEIWCRRHGGSSCEGEGSTPSAGVT